MTEEKKIATGYIGNALRSAADNHTTTFADEVFDTERQKYQNEVNTDLETTDNEIKADLKAETVRAKAAEGTNAQAVTDEKARATAAEEAIIYDVSAHNNGAVFESLSALLGDANLSTLIPTSVRRGGMNIKFIQGSEQSSDNKYVQYRLMTTSFSTNKTDWQGDAIMETDRIADGAVTFDKLYPDLQSLITNISKNYVFAGIATPTTNPGTPNGPVFYIITEPGVYHNFSDITIDIDEAAILVWNSGATWEKKVTGFASKSHLINEITRLDETCNNIFNTKTISLNIPDTFSGYLFSSSLFFRKKLDIINIKYNKETTALLNSISLLITFEDGTQKLVEIVSQLIDKSAGYFLYIGKYVKKIQLRVSNDFIKSGILSIDISTGLLATTDYVDFINNGFLYDFSYTASNSSTYKAFGNYKPDNLNGYKTDILDIYITSEVDFALKAQYNGSIYTIYAGHNFINVEKGNSSKVEIYTNAPIEEKTVTGFYVEGIYSIDSIVSELYSNTNNYIKEIETLKDGSEIHEVDAEVKNGNQIFWTNNKVTNCKHVIVKILEKTYDGSILLNVVDNGVSYYIPINNGIIKYYKKDSNITTIGVYSSDVTNAGHVKFSVSMNNTTEDLYSMFLNEIYRTTINVSSNVQYLLNNISLPELSVFHIIKKSYTYSSEKNRIAWVKNVDGQPVYGSLDFIGDYAIISKDEVSDISFYLNKNSISKAGDIYFEILTGYDAFIQLSMELSKQLQKKHVIVFDFDEPKTIDDSRYKILDKYGYKATLHMGITNTEGIDIARVFARNGYDVCPYLGAHYLDYTLDETIAKLENNIRTTMENLASIGIYNPVMCGCSGHKYGYALEKAFENTGYKFRYIRNTLYQGLNGFTYPDILCLPNELNQRPFIAETMNGIEDIKNNILNRIRGNYPITMFMCHSLVEEGNESSVASLLKEYFEQSVDFIHELEEQGEVVVMTMRQYYNYYFPVSGNNYDMSNQLR